MFDKNFYDKFRSLPAAAQRVVMAQLYQGANQTRCEDLGWDEDLIHARTPWSSIDYSPVLDGHVALSLTLADLALDVSISPKWLMELIKDSKLFLKMRGIAREDVGSALYAYCRGNGELNKVDILNILLMAAALLDKPEPRRLLDANKVKFCDIREETTSQDGGQVATVLGGSPLITVASGAEKTKH